jgi:flavin-dependent dehydrogenase
LGDAAGYVEPVTGEGVAGALEAAWDLAPLAERAVVNWDGRLVEEWEAACRLRMGSRQRVCRALTGLLRRPGVVRLLTALWERRLLSPQPLIGVINRLELPPREQAITGC